MKFRSIDEYHASFEGESRHALFTIRELIQLATTDAYEVVSYNLPAFTQNKVLIYYAAVKSLLGFYPAATPILHFSKQLSAFKTSMGALQFLLSQTLPAILNKKIIRLRLKEEMAKEVDRTAR